MKTKLSWIPFVPLALLAAFCKLATKMLPEGSVFGFSNLTLEYCYLAAVALIFLFAVFFSMMDRKIAKYYLPRMNIPAGIFGIVLAVAVAADGANDMIQFFSSGKADVLGVINAVFGLLSAVIFMVLGLGHIIRSRESKRFSLLYAVPAVLCGVRMILSFVRFTTLSLRLADVSCLICYAFATMFFYHYAIALSLIKAKNSVKNCIVFGLPAAAALIPYGVCRLVYSFDHEIIFNNLEPLEMLLIGLYIFAFVIELTIFVLKDEEVTIVEEEVVEINVAEEKVEGLIASNINEDEADSIEDDSQLESRDTEGFLYQEMKPEDDEPEENEEKNKEVESYLTDVEEPDAEEEDKRSKSYEDRLDDIDKLIIELTENSD